MGRYPIKPWGEEDCALLREFSEMGQPVHAIAQAMGRSEAAIETQSRKLKLRVTK
ncbi:MAG: hypothetical protein JOY99_12930 [Sphingomonadaceae bacterium]|nr:hypothetical protein [Sphingomonadaceae bacterium]